MGGLHLKKKRRYESIFLVSIGLCLFFAGCSPQRQLARLQKKHPYLFERQDTIVQIKTKEIARDTIFYSRTEVRRDTFYVDSIGYIYIHREIYGDSLGLKIYVPSDSISIPIRRYNLPELENNSWLDKMFNIVIFVGVLYIIGLFARILSWSRTRS